VDGLSGCEKQVDGLKEFLFCVFSFDYAPDDFIFLQRAGLIYILLLMLFIEIAHFY
jgi:hypothetical protein